MAKTKLTEDEQVFEHESYGTVGISRIVGNVGKLFGSSLENHYSSIRLRIHRAECYHSLGTDRYFNREKLIEVELSAVQFAEFITTSNVSIGVPCTIREFDGKHLPDPPSDVAAEATKIREAFAAKMVSFAAELKESRKRIKELLGQKNLKVSEREELSRLLDRVLMEVESNTPFMASQFEEATEKMAAAAKAEVDAFVTHNVIAEGYKSLVQKLDQQLNPDSTITIASLPEKSGNSA